MRALGLSAYFHDAAAALVGEEGLIAFAQEERFSRRKNDPGMPLRAATFCLRQAGLSVHDLDAVVWYEKPLLKFERVLLTSLRTFPRSATTFRRAMVSMVGDKLWVRNHLVDRLGVPAEKVRFAAHHESHAASAFLCSPFEEAAVLTVDGVGEWASTTTWDATAAGLKPLQEVHFPHSLGLLYSVFTAFLGFRVNEGEYKVMGLAAFGEPKYREQVETVLRRQADASFELDMDHFCFHREPDRSWTPAFEALFGPPRSPEGPMEQRHKDLAASVQVVLEECLLALCEKLHADTGRRYLCLAGGVALNSVAIGRILREGPFDDVFVQPAAGDAGGAVGAALLGAGSPRSRLKHAAWGQDVDPARARRFFDDGGIKYSEPEDICEAVAERLVEGQVVGWMQGRFELGPRALGQRSILADPREAEAKDRLNNKVKFREPFRPFAPSVLASTSPELFELGPNGAETRRFMTSVVPVKSDKIPAAVHVDQTARPQEVYPEDQPVYGRLLEAFGRRSGVACVLNTSFNLAGEPIVATVGDAYATFLRSDIDALAVGPFLVSR
ncbi:MAG: carbamoyl transferase [Alphaproteobacteria bacterium]|nr:carbamoyl transferase [Alphaproteobacteria bacterium]